MNEIERVVKRVLMGERVGVMSTSEQIAAALLFNRLDWLPEAYRHPIDAMSRLGSDWQEMVIQHHQKKPLA